jgi:hypothetical protein
MWGRLGGLWLGERGGGEVRVGQEATGFSSKGGCCKLSMFIARIDICMCVSPLVPSKH